MDTEKFLAIGLAALMLGSVVAGTVALSAETTSAAQSTTTPRFEVVNVSPVPGERKLNVTLKGTSSDSARNFNFTYKDLSGSTTTGPVELSNSSVTAHYDNGSVFNAGDPLTQSSGDTGRVIFTFDSSATGFAWVQNAFRVNATAYGAKYANAATGNRSVITANHYRVNAKDHNGNSISSVPILLSNPNTNATAGFTSLSSNPKQFHCRGVDIGGTCTNPDTDAASTLVSYPSPSGQPPRTAPAPIAFQTFALSESNASQRTDPGSRGSVTLTADTPSAPVFVGWQSVIRGNPRPDVDNITVVAAASGNVVYKDTGVSFETTPPVLLQPNKRYVVSLQNSSSFGTVNRSLVVPSKGSTGARFKITTGSVATSSVTGQVVDQSGNPVSDAVVIAQPEFAGGASIQIYNSTTTDSNGLFSMQVPETDQFSREQIGFRIIGTDTSDGTPIYYPTTDANDGEGYVVQSGKTVIPPMVLQQGGQVDINITSSRTSLPVNTVFSSLSQVSSAYPVTTRTANSDTFTTLSFGRQSPSSASVSLLSPTTGSETQVGYNVWGLGQQAGDWLCANTVSVSQGQETASTCSLEDGGYINLSVKQYGSIVGPKSPRGYADVEDFGFFSENELVIRNASTGDVVAYLGPDGAQQFFLGRDSITTDVRIPVPAGDYQLELRPAGEFSQWTTVNDTTTVSVTSGATTDVTLDRGRPFGIGPTSRFKRSLERSTDNTIAVVVEDPMTDRRYDDSNISATMQMLYPNGTTASSPVAMTYNSSDQTFETKTFKPKSAGLGAGRYTLAVTATNTSASGGQTYNTTKEFPVRVAGFDTYLSFSSRTVAPGSSLLGLIKAYDGGTGIDASASNITISVYDSNGKRVTQTTPSSGISGGQGSFSVAMPQNPGQYRVAVTITSNSGKQGIAERWVRVSQVQLSADTNKRLYAPNEPVNVTVEATNATSGAGIANATVELSVNGHRIIKTTNSNGVATASLDPQTYASGSTWQEGHPIRVTLTRATDSGVVRKTTGTGFEVRQFTVRAAPTSRAFTPSEDAKLNVFVPTDKTIQTVRAIRLDGESVSISGSKVQSGLYRVNLSQQTVGEHLAAVEVVTANSGTETATAQFAVQNYQISTSLNNRLFQTGETINLTVGVRKPDGTAVSSKTVSASLNATGPVRQVASDSSTTNSDGEVQLQLSSTTGGPHFVKVSVGNQERYVGLYVSEVSVRLENSTGAPVEEYVAEPGTTETIYVNATTSGGSAVADGSNVTAFVYAYGERIELGSATTSNGIASIDFSVPSSVPAQKYSLEATVATSNGLGTTSGVLNVTGANATQIGVTTNGSAYTPGETVQMTAEVTTGGGAPISGRTVQFVVGTEGASPKTVGTATTNADGIATLQYNVPTDASSGQYVVEASLQSASRIKAYSAYRVRNFDVSVEAADGPFNPGASVSLTVYANDSQTGNPVSASSGTVRLVLPGSNAVKQLSLSGSPPYDVSITVPDDNGAIGTRTVSVTLQNGSASDTDSTLVSVKNASASANLTVSEPVTAGQSTTVTVNGSVDTTAVLTAYSPGANTVAFNGSVQVNSTQDTQTQMTIGSPGTHIVKLEVPGVGTLTEVIDVQPASGDPTVWTGTGLNTNATGFTTSEDVYIKTNQPNMTATVVGENATYTVQLDSQSGDTYYGVLSATRPTGIYLVRLDSATSTGVDDTIIEVTA